MRFFTLFAIIAFLFSGCTKVSRSGKGSDSQSGKVEIIITPVVSGKPLYMDSIYTSPGGEQFSIKTLKFFLSNIAFARSVGTETFPTTSNPYLVHLLDFAQGDVTSTLGNKGCKLELNVKEGDYSDIRFDIGLPRFLNHGDPSTAPPPLDLGRSDMFWNWNTGYIFLLAEGYGKDVYKNSFHFAIGGDQRIIPLTFGNLFDIKPMVQVRKGKTIRIHFQFDFNKLLTNGNKTNYALNTFESTIVHGGYFADVLRMNAVNCFTFVSAETVE